MTALASRYTTTVAKGVADYDAVRSLRNDVYVREEGRLASISSSFDRYDRSATYLLTRDGNRLVGTIKIIQDSDVGLPCEEITSIDLLRLRGPVVEMGHFMTAPGHRTPALVRRMIRDAIGHAASHLRARFIIADMFFDGDDAKQLDDHFYGLIGAEPIHGPYADTRFLNAPTSLIGFVDVERLVDFSVTKRGAQKRLCQYVADGI